MISTKNTVLLILEDYLRVEKLKNQCNYDKMTFADKDDFRLQNDSDAKFYYEECGMNKEMALHADTMFSFWTLYSRLLELNAKWKAYCCSAN